MNNSKMYIGQSPVLPKASEATGKYVKINHETYYKISDFDAMPPFFMTVVSPSDHWLFLSSNGGLSAGRKNPESALFPYYTDDKIIDGAPFTGSKTLLKVRREDQQYLWEPFSHHSIPTYKISRNIYKSKTGNKVIFEEINEDLEIAFLYEWTFSDQYGLVKRSQLLSLSSSSMQVELLDGLQNLLPYGVNSETQNRRSTLVDAYKKNELEKDTGLGIFSLSSMIVDKAEPSEALRASTVWSAGIDVDTYLLSNEQVIRFKYGHPLKTEVFTKADKAAYFISCDLNLSARQKLEWITVAEVNQSSADVANLSAELATNSDMLQKVLADVDRATEALKRLVSLADGLQKGKDRLSTGRHFSNVLFNIMRGGIFEDQYKVDLKDFNEFAINTNSVVFQSQLSFFDELKGEMDYRELLELARQTNDADVYRICAEYLPLSFSRRHGDPSRPWNNFNIDICDEQGNKRRNYEGNWRDIFQNWEALALSFPGYLESMITKFVNASTIDGYNPYRITRDGIDWEIIEPDDPWSYIGYWGDHQVIYLLKLLEHLEAHYPGQLAGMMHRKEYVYANVPYRIRSYDSIVENPRDTVDFDHVQAEAIDERVDLLGSDGKLCLDHEGHILKANLSEKLLVMLLTKLYNFIPMGGIWLNTQRPEWNDANNALVGNGLSVVTLGYIKRFLTLAKEIFGQLSEDQIRLHTPVARLMGELNDSFSVAPEEPATNDHKRKTFIDELGKAGEAYRQDAYSCFDGHGTELEVADILSFFDRVQAHVDYSLKHNLRSDGLYHSYNILHFSGQKAIVSPLYEMLEGQVSILSSGLLNPGEAVSVLEALKKSAMYREDQYSYMLYPDRKLALFKEKSIVPKESWQGSLLVEALKDNNDNQLLELDKEGNLHFAGDLHNAVDIRQQLDRLGRLGYGPLVEEEGERVLQWFEDLFDHRSFTGRSGTFYGYEGLGSIYWHMVSKLLLAVQENIFNGLEAGASTDDTGKLVDHYYEIRAGIGINKSPQLYGAFPTDAYSHTPGNAGVQQPGMTGQVKEDVINRWAELGLRVDKGCLKINPAFLHKEEFLSSAQHYEYFDVNDVKQELEVQPDELAFTYCGVLFTYVLADDPKIVVNYHDGSQLETDELTLNAEDSNSIFKRNGRVQQIRVSVNL